MLSTVPLIAWRVLPAPAHPHPAGYTGKVREDIDHRAYMPGALGTQAVPRHDGSCSCLARARPARCQAVADACPCANSNCPPAAAWRVDDYLGGGSEGEEGDDDLDLAALRRHTLAFAKDRKDAMSRRWVGVVWVGAARWRNWQVAQPAACGWSASAAWR